MIQNYTEHYTAKNGSDEVENVWDEVLVWWDLGDLKFIDSFVTIIYFTSTKCKDLIFCSGTPTANHLSKK